MLKIGVITASHSIEMIKQVESYLPDHCELTFIPYRQIKEITVLYEQHHLYYDGILLSGRLAYKILLQHSTVLPTPTFYLEITEGDFYKHLFAIRNQFKELDFSRVFIDFLGEYEDSFRLYEVLKEDERPYSSQLEYADDIYEKTLQKHLTLWAEGKIDFAITRLSNIVHHLNEAGIPNTFIFPSKESIWEQLQQIIHELQISHLQENQWAIGIITITDDADDSELDFKQVLLHKALLEFNHHTNYFSIIQRQRKGFEVVTSHAELKKITNDFTNCAAINYLTNALPFQVNIGWGVGTTLYQTKKDAYIANNEAAANDFSSAYLIRDREEVIGPLGMDSCIEYSVSINPEIEKLSENLEISSLHIQKIMAVLAKNQSNELTSEDLAYHLGHTVRQANRILNKLEEKGVVETIYRKQEKLRGRPKKVYRIDFRKTSERKQ
ncbi:transcriptional regulator [Sporosarcina luteola]|uniref:transcriptional regulator n=1 Tax=Sporosarcina luteola TaxID=582850 RepID=UPI00203D621F|nr:transcriptional regulator [Sporosarcina luteola]MCM3711922.1 transcriptional regulator [Sporosarcina luteola]